MTKLIFAAIVVVLTAVGAQAMRTDGMRLSSNVIDLRGSKAERPKRQTELSAMNYILPPYDGGFWYKP